MDKIKETFGNIVSQIIELVNNMVNWITEFIQNAEGNGLMGFVAGALFLLGLCILIGLICWIRKTPKLFIVVIVIIAIFGGLCLLLGK